MADIDNEEKELDEKAVKKAEKERKKQEKAMKKKAMSESNNEMEEDDDPGKGSKFLLFLVALVLIALWLLLFALLIKWDVGGFGSGVLYPIFKDVPYVKEILPEVKDPDEADESLNTIMTQVLPSRCIKRAMNLLQKKNYASSELRRKLSEGGYPEEIVEKAVEYVSSYGYLDDAGYAADHIRYHSSQGRGRNRIRMELLQKGVSEEDFEKAWNEMQELGLIEDPDDAIRSLLGKKHFSQDMESGDRNKIAAFLMRRGYSAEDIFRVMRSYGE